MYGLMCVHDGHLKVTSGDTKNILEIKEGELMSFERLKDAISYRDSKLWWALKPVKVRLSLNVWGGKKTYSFV